MKNLDTTFLCGTIYLPHACILSRGKAIGLGVRMCACVCMCIQNNLAN